MSSSNFGMEAFGFSTYSIMSSEKSESLTSLLIQMPLISFCCLIAEARTSSTLLNSSGDSGHPCHVPDLRGKALFFPIENDICCGFFIDGFDDIEVCTLTLHFEEFRSRKDAIFCEMLFQHLLRVSYGSCSFFY